MIWNTHIAAMTVIWALAPPLCEPTSAGSDQEPAGATDNKGAVGGAAPREDQQKAAGSPSNGDGVSASRDGTSPPLKNEWAPLSFVGEAPGPRSGHAAIWTGSQMIVWGGTVGAFFSGGSSGSYASPPSNGFAYDPL